MRLFGSKKKQSELQAEEDSRTTRVANAVVGKLMDVGLDGLGPLDSVGQVVEEALAKEPDREAAIDRIYRDHIRMAAAGGFVTGVGGLITLPVALPANIAGFYVLATRMVGAMASVRGYDVTRPEVRSALLLALVGADSDDLLRKAGVTSGGRLAQVAVNRLPRAAMMVINKGVGFRVATQMGARTLGRLGRVVPVVGGVIGAGLDRHLMKQIAEHAREEFPPREQVAQG